MGRVCQLRRMSPGDSDHYQGLLSKVTRQAKVLMLRHGVPPEATEQEKDVLRDIQIFIEDLLVKERAVARKERQRTLEAEDHEQKWS